MLRQLMNEQEFGVLKKRVAFKAGGEMPQGLQRNEKQLEEIQAELQKKKNSLVKQGVREMVQGILRGGEQQEGDDDDMVASIIHTIGQRFE